MERTEFPDKRDLAEAERKRKAAQILRQAKEAGVDSNGLFQTTFQRYCVQLKTLDELEEAMSKDGVLVTKEYVRGSENVYIHPAIQQYDRTTDSANKTANTIMKIIRTFGVQKEEADPLMEMLTDGD